MDSTSGGTARHGGAPRKLPDDAELLRLHHEEKLDYGEIAERYSVARASVRSAFSRIKAKQDRGEAGLPPWPWRIKTEHMSDKNNIYLSMLAYKKWRAGRGLDSRELALARKLEQLAKDWHYAVTYDPDKGFVFTKRRPEHGDEMFV